MLFKRYLAVSVCMTLIAAIVLSACSAPATTQAPEPAEDSEPTEAVNTPDPAEPVTLTVWGFYGATTPFTDETIAAFEAENPGITVKVEELGWDAFWEKLPVAIASDETPDVVTTGLMWAPEYTVNNVYADLMPLSGGMVNGQAFEEVLPNGMLEAARDGDKVVGMPYDFDAYAYYYRKDVFDAAGVTEIPGTWDELFKALQAVSKSDQDQYAIMVDPSWNSWDPLLYAFGGEYIGEDGRAAFNSPEAVASLEFMKRLVDEGVGYVPSPGEYTSVLASGRVVSFYNGPYMMGVLRTSAPDLSGQWRVAMLPEAEQFGTHIGGVHLAIMEQSPNKEAAWKFIEFMMREENQIALFETSGAAPALIPAMNSDAVAAPDPYFGDQITLPIFQETINNGVPNPTIELWTEVAARVNSALQEVLISGADPLQALDAAAEDVNAMLGQ